MIDQAIAFAATAHAGQRRRYTGEPYVLHPIEVMQLVREHDRDWTENMLVAALLHDVVEDTSVGPLAIERRFGNAVRVLVDELTDEFTFEKYPDMNRKARKKAERERLGAISAPGQSIKLADMISNTRSIAQHDPGFAKVYLREKALLLPLLCEGSQALQAMAQASLMAGAEIADVDLTRRIKGED